MGIHQRKIPPHWNYFLSLEEDILRMSRWIEFDKANQNCYSLELARLLMVGCAEVDVVAKALCAKLSPVTKAESIKAYQSVLVKSVPDLPKAKVQLPQFGLTFTPWDGWKEKGTPPSWWTANNKVKHHRAENFDQASLKHVLNAAAGLLVLLMLYYRQTMPSIRPAPRIFDPASFGHLDGDFLVFRKEG